MHALEHQFKNKFFLALQLINSDCIESNCNSDHAICLFRRSKGAEYGSGALTPADRGTSSERGSGRAG